MKIYFSKKKLEHLKIIYSNNRLTLTSDIPADTLDKKYLSYFICLYSYVCSVESLNETNLNPGLDPTNA